MERADGQLMIGYHGETAIFRNRARPRCGELPAPSARNSNPSLTIQPTATSAALDSLEPPDEEEVSAKRGPVTKVGRGQ